MSYTETQGIQGAGFTPGNYVGHSSGPDYQEVAYPDGSGEGISGTPTMIKKRYVFYKGFSLLNKFLGAIVGYPEISGGVLYRNLPEMINQNFFTGIGQTTITKPSYYASKILGWKGDIPDGSLGLESANDPTNPNSNGTFSDSQGEYLWYYVDVLFEQLNYNVCLKTQLEYPEFNELGRFVYYDEKVISKALLAGGTDFTLKWDETPVSGITISKGNLPGFAEIPYGQKYIVLRWLDVPTTGGFNYERMEQYIGCVNNDTFPFDDYYPAETVMLMQSPTFKRHRHQAGFYVYDIDFLFQYSPIGWNSIYNPSLQPQAFVGAGGQKVRTLVDMTQLFAP